MIILAFDACFGACSAALAQGTDQGLTTLASDHRIMARGHAEALVPMIEGILATANLSLQDVDRIATTRGPGTFAGVRVGIATARALALANGKPIVAVGTLEAIAQTALAQDSSITGHVAIVRDARRDQVYLQSFEITHGRATPTMGAPVICAPADVPDVLPQPVTIALGAGASLVPWPQPDAPACRDVEIEATAVAVAHLASDCQPETSPVSPLYLRPPDAKPQSGFALERQT